MTQFTKIKLLVIEDEQGPAALLKRIFERKHYEVHVANNGTDGIALAQKVKPHIAFLDIGLPDISGLEVLPQLKSLDVTLRVIMVTGYQDKAEQALTMGASDYITKPYTPDYLENVALGKVYAQLFEKERSGIIQTVMAFNKAVEARDSYTAQHSEEVSAVGIPIAKELDLPITQDLEFGLILHDIGKIGIPDAVLRKPGKLTDEEFEQIKQHPKIGYDILINLDLFKTVAEIVYCHQERYDGKGYPRGLQGEAIPIEARIIAVADTYHAMTSKRPYRDPLPMDIVIAELTKHKGTQFDPAVVDAFIRANDKGMIGEHAVSAKEEQQ